MALREADIANFETLKRACLNGNLALIECQNAETGEYLAVICAVSEKEGEFMITPFGNMCTGDPYKQYVPPS
jgi:hypothetical protein